MGTRDILPFPKVQKGTQALSPACFNVISVEFDVCSTNKNHA